MNFVFISVLFLATKVIFMELLFKINIFCGCLEWIKNKLLGMATSIGLNVEVSFFILRSVEDARRDYLSSCPPE